MALDPHAMDQSVTYQDMEPMIESIVSDPLPDGLVDPEWLELPEIEPSWLDLPEMEPGWQLIRILRRCCLMCHCLSTTLIWSIKR